MIALIQKLIDGEGSEAENHEWLRVIAANVPAPIGLVTDLIFYCEGLANPEEVLDKALSYNPRVIALPAKW